MQVLGMHLRHRSSRLVQHILITLRNLSDIANRVDNLDELLRTLIDLLSSNDVLTLSYVLGILSNLTCNHSRNKVPAVHLYVACAHESHSCSTCSTCSAYIQYIQYVHTIHTVHTVHAIHAVHTVHIVHTVHTIHVVHTVHTVHTVHAVHTYVCTYCTYCIFCVVRAVCTVCNNAVDKQVIRTHTYTHAYIICMNISIFVYFMYSTTPPHYVCHVLGMSPELMYHCKEWDVWCTLNVCVSMSRRQDFSM